MKFPTEAAERVARCLAEHGPSTAAAIAQALGISAAAVRRPLRALQDSGLVQALDRAPYGPDPDPRRGRPSQVFTLTAAGRAACDQAYDALALEALRFMARREGREAVAAFAAERAERLVAGVRETGSVTVQDLADHLSAEGFAATVEPLARDGAQLCMHHCPVVDAAGEFPELCEAETAALGAVLGRHVTRLATLAHGDGICTTLIPGVNDDPSGESSSTSAIAIEEKVNS